MSRYIVCCVDGTVREINAEGLLETDHRYILLRPYRQGLPLAHEIEAAYRKDELSARPERAENIVWPSLEGRPDGRGWPAPRFDGVPHSAGAFWHAASRRPDRLYGRGRIAAEDTYD